MAAPHSNRDKSPTAGPSSGKPHFNTKHGHSRVGFHTPEYETWTRIKGRCHNPANPAYPDYGGRGIKVCDEWRDDFSAFLAAVGLRPSPQHSIDRYPDNDGNYAPGNVRWATRKEQARNRRTNRLLEFRGETRTLAEWAEIRGIPANTLYQRILMGWTVERLLTQPVDPAKSKKAKRYVGFQGKKMTVSEFAGALNMDRTTVRARIVAGWTVERIAATPPQVVTKDVPRFEFQGKQLTPAELARVLGLNKETVRARLRLGWSIERIATTPPGPSYCRKKT